MISSYEASLLYIKSLLYITDTSISKKELIAEIEEKIQNLKWKVISKEAGIATNVGIGLRDKKSSNQQQREEKRQKWRRRKNQITMSPETHPSIKQTRSENSDLGKLESFFFCLESSLAESKEKAQLKGTEPKEKENNELAKRKEEAYRAQKEEEMKTEEARITNLRKELELSLIHI